MSFNIPVYLDNHATTRVDPRVVEVMLRYLKNDVKNRSNFFGLGVEEGVDEARAQIGKLINATSKEIVFTSGATESNNLAIKGIAEACRERGNHIITQVSEHKSVLDSCKSLERRRYEVTYLPVRRDGRVDMDDLRRAVSARTILITIMYANNEIGVIQPIQEIGIMAKARGIVFHVDAAQAVGKVPIDVRTDGIDLLSISAHKLYGPKGVGALYVRRKNPRVRLSALFDGGGHERGMRSGALNVPGIVGLGKACELCRAEMPQEVGRMSYLRDRLTSRIMSELSETYINGSTVYRLPHNINLSFPIQANISRIDIKGVAASSGSACSSARSRYSHVLEAIGVDRRLTGTSIRFGVGRFNTVEEVDFASRRVVETVEHLRGLSLYDLVSWRSLIGTVSKVCRMSPFGSRFRQG
jgi:cysteine desulfurase